MSRESRESREQAGAGAVVVVMTWPDAESAGRAADAIVDERLAACVQVQGGVRSTFRWEGKIDHADEQRMEIKTVPERLPELKRRLVALHPYDVPELLVLPVIDGLDAYVEWVHAETTDAG